MTFVVHIYFYLVCYCPCTVIYAIYIPHLHRSFQFLQSKPISSCHLSIHEHPYYATIQEHFYYYPFVGVYLFYTNIQPHFFQHLKCLSHLPLLALLPCCTFWGFTPCTAWLYFILCRMHHITLFPSLPWASTLLGFF